MKAQFKQKGQPILLKKAIGIGVLILLFLSLVFAITGYVNTFSDGSTNKSLTFNNSAQTLFLNFPKYAYVNNASLDIFISKITNCLFFDYPLSVCRDNLLFADFGGVSHNGTIITYNWFPGIEAGWQVVIGTDEQVNYTILPNGEYGVLFNSTFGGNSRIYIEDQAIRNEDFVCGISFNDTLIWNVSYFPGGTGVIFSFRTTESGDIGFSATRPTADHGVATAYNFFAGDAGEINISREAGYHYVFMYYNGTNRNISAYFDNFTTPTATTITPRSDQSLDIGYAGKLGTSWVYEWLVCWNGTIADIPANVVNAINVGVNISNNKLWQNSEWNSSETAALNITPINNILSNNCTCNNCSFTQNYCQIPFTLYANDSTTIDISIENINYSYGVDNCSGTDNILNATALIIKYEDLENSPLTVNSTVKINYFDEYYETTLKGATNHSICVYPPWLNVSSDLEVTYKYNPGINYYNFETYLNNITQFLTLFGQPSGTDTVTFTVYDVGEELSGVMATMYRRINSEWQPIESKETDLTGRVQFTYEENVEYKFFFAKSGYENYIFYLNPVLFESYSVPMTRSLQLNTSIDYEDVGIAYYPKTFYEFDNFNFTFIIQSPKEKLESYSYRLTYPGGDVLYTGNEPIGEEMNSSHYIGNCDFDDTMIVKYCYTTIGYSQKCYTDIYPITLGNQTTLIGIKDKTYGLGLFERILTATIIGIVTAGLAALVGQIALGLVLTFFVWGFLTYIGFIPLWAVLISIAIGLLLLGLRGGNT